MIKSTSFINARRQGGFTMVELAIVLVIAGIILAAVLKGTDMINKAKVERMTADLRGLQGMVLENEKRTGHLAGDCNENGIIEFVPPVGNVNNNTFAPNTLNVVGDPDGATRCATIATGEDDVNLAWSDMRKANVVDPTRTNLQLAKHVMSDFYAIGSMTPTVPAGGNAVNTIVVYGVPLWLAKGIDVAIDGPQSTAGEELFGGARGRIRFYSDATNIQNGGGGAAWPTDAVGSGDYQLVAFSYQFDTRMALPAL